MSEKLRIWAQLPPMPREQLIAAVQRFETAALEGIWCSQTFGAPFGPLSAAAVASRQLKLGSGIALAFVRSPLETACNVMDLDLLSGGRSVLGLGSSAKSLTEDAFGMPYGKPLRHMREVIKFIRLLIAQAHTGELGVLEGEYHRLDLRHFRTFAPPVRSEIPIYLPAVFEKACEMAGEIGDGLLGHPLWNERWIAEKTLPALRRGLAAGSRERSTVTLNLQMFVAVNPDRRAAIADARPSVAYYSQSPQYLPYFDEIGFGAEARALQECFARGDLAGMVAACSDAMVESIAIVGSVDEVRRRMRERTREADACTPVIPHYALAQDKLDFYTAGIADVFYGG